MSIKRLTIHSGGALGADSIFGYYGTVNNHKVVHHLHKNQKCYSKHGVLVYHSDDELIQMRSRLKGVCNIVQKNYPSNENIEKILLRNMFQIEESEAVVAIAPVVDLAKWVIHGGAGYAVAGARLLNISVYVFDLENHTWFHSPDNTKMLGPTFSPNVESLPPRITGIGSREINEAGKQEIVELLTI